MNLRHILGQHILCIETNISNISFKNKPEYIFYHSGVLKIFPHFAYNESSSINIDITGALFEYDLINYPIFLLK